MEEIDPKIFEIQRELLEIKTKIVKNIRNKLIHRNNIFNNNVDINSNINNINIANNIIDNIEALRQLIIIEPAKFNAIPNFISELRKIFAILNHILIGDSIFANPRNEKDILSVNLNIISKEIDKLIKLTNISEDTIKNVREIIHNEKQINSFINKDTTSENLNYFLQQELEEKIKKLEEKTKESENKTKKLEKELSSKEAITNKTKELEEEIKQLQEETKKSKEETKKSKEEKEKNEIERKKLEEEYLQYLNETEKINQAIDKLKNPAQELIESKKIFERNRDNYNKYAMDSFKIAIVAFVMIILNLFFFVGINDIIKSEKNLTLGFYLINIFPIIFPTILGFLFIRQSNINAQEVQKINRRFILIHEVNQSLQALVEVNRGKDMDNKTEKVIDKLIENILNYASENSSTNSNTKDMNFAELNESIDKLIDTIDKKISLVKE